MTIGRPIATNEPKVINSTIIAASRPMAVAAPSDGFCTCSIAWPPSATCSCGEPAPLAALITRSVADAGSTFARSSKVTVAKAILPSAEIVRAPCRRSTG